MTPLVRSDSRLVALVDINKLNSQAEDDAMLEGLDYKGLDTKLVSDNSNQSEDFVSYDLDDPSHRASDIWTMEQHGPPNTQTH